MDELKGFWITPNLSLLEEWRGTKNFNKKNTNNKELIEYVNNTDEFVKNSPPLPFLQQNNEWNFPSVTQFSEFRTEKFTRHRNYESQFSHENDRDEWS